MNYHSLQERIYQNKVRRNFNVIDVSKEVILMSEELGELCDAYLEENQAEIVDAVGDLMVYGLGLSAMFKWNADEIINLKVKVPQNSHSLENYLPYLGREVGMLAKNYKKSNKLSVTEIDRREQFQEHLGKLMGYCSIIFDYLKVDSNKALESIISINEGRTHQGQI